MATKETKRALRSSALVTFIEVLNERMERTQNWAKLNERYFRKDHWVVYAPSTVFSHYMSVIGNLTGDISEASEPAFRFVRSTIKEGLPREAFDRIKNAIATTTEVLSSITEIPARTIARRKKFKPDESERLFRVASAFQKAVETLKDLEKARRWFTTPKTALSGLSPIVCCDTETGCREVENLLGRIDESVYS